MTTTETDTKVNSALWPACRSIGGGHDSTCTTLREPTQRELAKITRDRERWAEMPDILLDLEADLVLQLTRPAPPECPDWFDEPNHDGCGNMGGRDGDRQILSHSMKVSDGVFIVVDEYRERDDTVTRTTPFIHAYSDGVDMTAEQAEAHGQALLTAAGKLPRDRRCGMITTLTPAQIVEFRAASDDPAVQAWLDRDIWNAEHQPTPPACPSWCTEIPGHRFDIGNAGTIVWSRQHTADMGEYVVMVQDETFDAGTDVVTLDPRFMTLWIDGNRVDGGFTPESALALVAAIGTGVREYEEIIAGGAA